MIIKAVSLVYGYVKEKYAEKEMFQLKNELLGIVGPDMTIDLDNMYSNSYEEVQIKLSSLNEKESIRKSKGVYYTPSDVVRFIVINSFKLATGMLKSNNLSVMDLNGIPYKRLCYEKTVFDPTCGAGEFLLKALEVKFDLIDLHKLDISKSSLFEIVGTIQGNDINEESILITKLRIFILILNRYGISKVIGLAEVLKECFFNRDFVTEIPKKRKKYDVIIGNPPYVEDTRSDSKPLKKYGNIYANVLDNSANQLNDEGVIAFVVPLSYVSTPRMKKIREKINETLPEQYILSYSDRPDCLFASVHQKLSLLFAKKVKGTPVIYTGNYKYWYKSEREQLFCFVQTVKNHYVTEKFIPKLGTKNDLSIYEKIKEQDQKVVDLFDGGNESISVSMRAAFWVKAFLKEHDSSEYKTFYASSKNRVSYAMCLFNSSLFWWYWVCVSDCWHITNKELKGFTVPNIYDKKTVDRLANNLENQLEKTKLYVGTKQTEFEYKHKLCVEEIHDIDDYINNLFKLNEEESKYIKNFAYRYRVSEGAIK